MTPRRLVFVLPAALFAGLLAYFLVALQHDPSVLPSAMIDQPAPDFTLAGIGEQPGFAHGDIKGRVVLINFFASWCAPCRIEHPLLMRLSGELGVPLYGVDYEDKPADAAKFLGEFGNPFHRVGMDPNGRLGIDFGVTGVPETYVVDKSGRIRLRHVGPLTREALDREIGPLVKALQKS